MVPTLFCIGSCLLRETETSSNLSDSTNQDPLQKKQGISMSMTTNAVVMREIGGPEVLDFRQVTLSWPAGSHDVLVRLKAASVNPADIWLFRAACRAGR